MALPHSLAAASTQEFVVAGVVGTVGWLVLSLTRWVLSTLRPRCYPPGPKVIPGLGNLLDIPIDKPYLQFHKWAQQYGPMVGLKTGAGNLVILNKPGLVNEIFDKRGAVCSDRPVSHVLTKHVTYNPEERQIAIIQYDDFYRRWRKSFNYILSNVGIRRVLPLMEVEAANVVVKCLDGGQNYVEAVRYWALATPLIVTAGQRLQDMPAEYIGKFHHSQELLLAFLIPGSAVPVDIFPILKYVPFMKWRQEAKVARKYLLRDADIYLQGGKRQLAKTVQDPAAVGFECLITKIMNDQRRGGGGSIHFTDTELGFIGQAIVGAGFDTTLAAFQSLMVALAAHPAVLARVQAEADQIAAENGTGGPPTGTDAMDKLIYLRACIQETLRWRPSTPAALPHVLTREVRLGDYVFPKGTTLIANAWTLNRDPEVYDRPDDYVPERWLAHPLGIRASSKADTDDADTVERRALYAFGSGRRQCPGEQFALTTLLVAAAKMVWAYDVLPPPGGVDISIETGFQDGVVTQPRDPRVVFRLRGEDRKKGLMEDMKRTGSVAKALLG